MALSFYNTLSREIEEFKEIDKGKVLIYSCGPTVYDFAHIGNFRSYIFADILNRYLTYKGYIVKHVMNITDVDDKTIKRAKDEKVNIKDITDKYTSEFFVDMKKLGIINFDMYPRATENIDEMVKLIKRLKEKGYVYKSGSSYYYNISAFSEYGKLAKLDIDGLMEGVRISTDEYEKDNARDFVLWKGWKKEDDQVYWNTELGKGRPGWHIECSVMSMKYLGETMDIHTGGVDLIFPHHENEIAQSEGATGKRFVNYWLHCEHLLVDNKKMSKSKGNFYTLRDLEKMGYSAIALRYLLLTKHYRKKLNFTLDGLKSAEASLNRIHSFVFRIDEIINAKNKTVYKKINIEELNHKLLNEFEEAMDSDLNTSRAISALFSFINEINKLLDHNLVDKDNADKIMEVLKRLDNFFNFIIPSLHVKIPEDILKLVEKRKKARKDKNWAEADRIRDLITKQGYTLQDTREGIKIKRI